MYICIFTYDFTYIFSICLEIPKKDLVFSLTNGSDESEASGLGLRHGAISDARVTEVSPVTRGPCNKQQQHLKMDGMDDWSFLNFSFLDLFCASIFESRNW